MKRIASALLLTLCSVPAFAQYTNWGNWIRLGTGIGSSLLGLSKDPVPQRPSDWMMYGLTIEDSRYPVGHKKRKSCNLDLIEINYTGPQPRKGTVLLLSGLMENAHAWDLNPWQGVSYARWLMNRKGLKVYMLNIRGVGLSRDCYFSKSNLDDIAIDDIPAAMSAISAHEGKENFFVIGHSMGGIALQASLAGLTRCDEGNCFDPQTAQARQALIDGIVAEGANVAFTLKDQEVTLKAGAQFERLLKLVPSDRISAKSLQSLGSQLDPLLDTTRASLVLNLLKDPLLHFLFWKYFYSAPNVNTQTRDLFKNVALDATNRGTLEQYAIAIRGDGIQATGGQLYADNLGNITLPVALAVFEKDKFANWNFTEADDYNRLGSPEGKKEYFRYPGQGHQDFMLNAQLHEYQSQMIDWLMSAASMN